ncbi:pro-neuropeptide Y-like [Copidosoma floridanum]|uniref:pro-neuropeptide Y-like n=1 Tax=Copidosoma floridanum TaxID=29053 RepID=UPI0006C9CBD3|nr:pro-neuropeptide Y-like [Copidosoma floridanum]
MRTSKEQLQVMYFVLGIIILQSITAQSDTEPMARITRPEVFSNPDDLKQFLDLVKGYYSLNGKARYGKRKDMSMDHYVCLRPSQLHEQKLLNLQNISGYKRKQEKSVLRYFQPRDCRCY